MSQLLPDKAVFLTTLAADVTNSSTFTIAYPTGFTQGSFTGGNAQAAYMVVNKNNRYAAVDSKMSVTFGSTTITVTNSTGQTLTAGSEVLVNIGVNHGPAILIQVPATLVSIGGAVDVVTAMSPGLDGVLEYIEFVTTAPVTTAAKLATVSPFINAVAVTGGAVALTSAAVTPLGKVVVGSAITANNVITYKDTLSLKATAVTAFAEGAGFFNIRIRLANPNAY